MARLAAEVRNQQQARIAAATLDAAARLALWLIAESSEHGPLIPLPGGQQGLGEAIGASRVTTNRCLKRLQAAAIITIEPRCIRVLAPELLTKQAPGNQVTE